MTEHDIKYDGCSPHNGEYWYECRRCGKSDWLPWYGRQEQLSFYSASCQPKPDKAELLLYSEISG